MRAGRRVSGSNMTMKLQSRTSYCTAGNALPSTVWAATAFTAFGLCFMSRSSRGDWRVSSRSVTAVRAPDI
jgi:hypothetical protein